MNKAIYIIGGVLLAVLVAHWARARRYGVPAGSEQYKALYEQESVFV